MLPLVGSGPTIAKALESFRNVFCRDAGFAHISRYISGLLLSPNKTLQGIYTQLVWPEGEQVSYRAMHEAIFEAGWQRQELMEHHRSVVGPKHRGRGREVISLDWTYARHSYSQEIFGAKKAYDHVDRRWSRYQTVVTAVVANSQRLDGIAVEIQQPNYEQEELAYLQMTRQDSYESMEQVRQRLIELLHYQKNRLEYRKRTEMVVEVVRQLEEEGSFPKVDYAFDQGVLTRELTQVIESAGKHWVSEIERSRNIFWEGKWQRVEIVWHRYLCLRFVLPTCRGDTGSCTAYGASLGGLPSGRKKARTS